MTVKKKIPFTINVLTVTMATNLSIVIDKSKYKNMLIIMPTTWTAADITFVVSSTKAGDFVKLVVAEFDTAVAEVTVDTPVANEAIALYGKAREALEACPFVKIRSGTAATPVNQDDPRTFTIVLS